MSNAIRNLVIALVITLMLGGGYFWYTSQHVELIDNESALLSSGKILEDIRNLETYTLDTAFMDTPAYKSLQSYKVISEDTIPTGRKNPFIPLQ